MPFVRFSRDRRGYECVYLIEVPGRQARGQRPRILYWYRTPPGLKIGREAFDASMRQTLESQYPNLTFDWKQISETPMPPPEAPSWRERRRAERAVRRARSDEPADHEDIEGADGADGPDARADVIEATAATVVPDAQPAGGREIETASNAAQAPRSGKKRRRRRGGRGRREPQAAAAVSPAGADAVPVAPATPDASVDAPGGD